MGWVWGLKMRMVLEESQDLLNTQETGRSNGFPRPWKLLIYHRSPTLPDKMISFSITCKELKLSCRYWRMESFSFSYCLHHDVSALGLRLYMWVSPCWHGCNLPSLISFSPLGVLWEHHQAAGPLGQAGLGRGIEEMGWALGWGWTTSRSTGIRSRAFQSPWPQKTFLDVPPGDIMTILSSEELHCKTENCARSQREPADKDQMGWNRRQANWWGQGVCTEGDWCHRREDMPPSATSKKDLMPSHREQGQKTASTHERVQGRPRQCLAWGPTLP